MAVQPDTAPVGARAGDGDRARRGGDARSPDPADWPTAIARAVADPEQPRLVYQPIVDAQRGIVVGYEVLARFDGPPTATPDKWFAAAADCGVAAELEAAVIRAACERLDDLPPNTFLTVNVDPNLLASPEVVAALATRERLDRLVLEITEHAPVHDYEELLGALETYKAAGALVAIDDAGAGYAGLHHILTVRPQFVKLDRALVTDVDREPAKQALVELVGQLAGRVDAWILAEGIERIGELEELVRLGVPLLQGYLLGRPTAQWVEQLPEALVRVITDVVGGLAAQDPVAAVVERAPAIPETDVEAADAMFLEDPGLRTVVVVDAWSRPVALRTRGGATSGVGLERRLLRVSPDACVADVALRAAVRPEDQRFDPIVCSDGRGAYVGLISVDRLLVHLARGQVG